jgi:LytS/YehU family sensor histidine kinase
VGNLFVFLLYYFIYAAYIYFALNSKNSLLVWPEIKNITFRRVAYGSWFSIGKYVLLLAAFYILRFYTEYRMAARQRLQLAVLNKDMQLNLLKLQLNPHFYFNTLNNLYGLSRSSSSQLVPALNQLENIMQYVITDCNKPRVSLQEEIQFLKSYVELERLRYEENTRIDFAVEGTIGVQQIVPLLLIQFVENAFKHGMKEKQEQNWMKVFVQVNNNQLLFKVENSDYSSSPSQGIGITSVQHLLNLQYEGKHTLEMLGGDNQFSVTLKLDLL